MNITASDSISTLRTQLTERRMVRQRRRVLREELGSYRTASEQAELFAILGRHDAEDTDELLSLIPAAR